MDPDPPDPGGPKIYPTDPADPPRKNGTMLLKKMIKMRKHNWAYLEICAIEKYIFHLRVLQEVSIVGYVAPRKRTSAPFTMKNPWGFSKVFQGKITRIPYVRKGEISLITLFLSFDFILQKMPISQLWNLLLSSAQPQVTPSLLRSYS